MADQLLALYAQRKTTPGFTFSPDSNFQREFEDAFEFEETADQITAISDIKRDMERGQPMDRLLCGDVGYGKTEVAMRAAFKTVMDNKQVAVPALPAPPIPGTLHMSLVGLRDMSVIETPPRDRLAIQTVVAPFQEDLIRRAIETELAREGQVFFIHNRVESIHSLGDMVTKLVPKARVVVAHGQMGEKALESA